MGAASKTGSCICASLSLPWQVRRPAIALGHFLTLDLVARCSSTSGAVIEFWCPGTRCWSPVPSTLRRVGTFSVFLGFEVLDPGFLPPTSGRSFIGGTSAWSGPLLRATAVSGLWAGDCGLLRRRRIHARVWLSPVFLSFQEWRSATSQYP